MNTAELAHLTTLLSIETMARVRKGDKRSKSAIMDDILREAGAPELATLNARIAKMIGWHRWPME